MFGCFWLSAMRCARMSVNVTLDVTPLLMSDITCCQGQCVVEAAVTANVEHIVYDGTTYVKPSDGLMCGFLASRLEIEEIIVRSGLSAKDILF